MKNYVKVYEGHAVPEGATHFGGKHDRTREDLFYRSNGREVFIFGGWRGTFSNRGDLIELPEAPQEWDGEGLPPVGVECIVNITEGVCGLSDQELKLNGEKVSVISNVKNKRGFDVTVFEISEGGVFCFSSKLFRPLKTQQEKDREAFVAELDLIAREARVDMNVASRLHFYNLLFEAGFTAPKASNNE